MSCIYIYEIKNIKHYQFIKSFWFSGGGDKKILSQRTEWKAQSKVGSTDNIRHRAGGGDIKVKLFILLIYRIYPNVQNVNIEFTGSYTLYIFIFKKLVLEAY